VSWGKAKGPLIAIVGPTAVGKSELALRLAEEFGGEIVSADSRQIYRGLDIGTAKPTAEERQRVPHHLLDVVNPDEVLTLAQYQELAYAAIDDILARGKVPFLVGGTGLYIKAVVEGWSIPRVPPNERLRAELYRLAELEGPEALHARLREVDPAAAARIDPRNVRRVIRALEVCLTAGRPISQLQARRPPPYRILRIGLTMPREELYRRIDERADRMIARGLVEEVRRQFKEIPGLLEGKVEPEYTRCVDIATRGALGHLVVPCLLAAGAPFIVVLALGREALAGVLAGCIVSGIFLALLMANVGCAWDNAKKFIEAGELGGKGSLPHKASVVADTVGDPLKDTAGPTLNILIEMVAAVSVAFVPLFLRIFG